MRPYFSLFKTKIMGEFLHIGFIAKATAELPKTLTKDEVNAALANFYPETTFDCMVSKDKITWTLKPAVVQEELADFAETFYRNYYGGTNNRGLPATLAFIREIAPSKNWLKRAEEEEDYSFSVTEDGGYDSFTIGEKQKIRLSTTAVTLGSEGKFLMEEYRCTLRFLETCAQQTYAQFRLGKTIRVFVF